MEDDSHNLYAFEMLIPACRNARENQSPSYIADKLYIYMSIYIIAK